MRRGTHSMQLVGRFFALCTLLSLFSPRIQAAELTAETVRAWNQYLQWANEKVQRELSDSRVFLIQNTLSSGDRAALKQQLESGQITVRRMERVVPRGTKFEVPGGEIHHWWGSILLRNVSLPRVLRFLQDYDHHAGKFADVERSKLLSAHGNHYRFFLRLRRSKAFVTAYYNTEQECDYTLHDSKRASSRSEAIRIGEVEDAGTASEHERKPGNDRGFLWRLVSWWRFEQAGDDVIVELESASLSRDIPAAVKWMPGVSSYIRSTPRESMESVLASIREYAGK
jgi:hypothetical protein